MSYRDDRDADQARIAALEAELTTAKGRIDELEGKRSQALVLASRGALTPAGKAQTAAVRWAGAPLDLELERQFSGGFPTDRLEELLPVIRSVTRDHGRTELLRSSLTWAATHRQRGAGPFTCITIATKDGTTTLTATDRLGALAGALHGGIGGGVGGGTLALPIVGALAAPALAPVFVGGWLALAGGTYLGTRALFRVMARRRAEALQRVFDAVAGEIERVLAASTAGGG
jgi:hypothetical protein